MMGQSAAQKPQLGDTVMLQATLGICAVADVILKCGGRVWL